MLLSPLSWLFGCLVAIKNTLYDHGLKKVTRLDRPVISVGNLAMGGTGKSPTTSAIVAHLEQQGLKVAILSRGYGRKHPKTARVVNPMGDWQLFGDEPMMLAQRHPNAWVAVGPDRAAAAAALKHKPDVYVIDDGLQHRQLHRDLEIVLIDLTQPMPKLFPTEMFREDWRALKRADLVLLTRWDGHSDTAAWQRQVRQINPELPIIHLSFKSDALRNLKTGKIHDPKELQSRKVAAFSGIAQPEKFFNTLTKLGLPPVVTLPLRDHAALTSAERAHFLEDCRDKGVEVIITTEKDAVKLDKVQGFGILLFSLSINAIWEKDDTMHLILNRVIKAGL